eukprot:3688439-Pleurochrysis_carterae.AAC.2
MSHAACLDALTIIASGMQGWGPCSPTPWVLSVQDARPSSVVPTANAVGIAVRKQVRSMKSGCNNSLLHASRPVAAVELEGEDAVALRGRRLATGTATQYKMLLNCSSLPLSPTLPQVLGAKARWVAWEGEYPAVTPPPPHTPRAI